MKKKIHTETANWVECGNMDCRRRFELTSPGDVVLALSVDDDNKEVAPRIHIFACPRCQRTHTEAK